MSKPGYTSVYDHYSAKMMKLSLSVGVVWAMSSICLSIILVMVFIQVRYQELKDMFIFTMCSKFKTCRINGLGTLLLQRVLAILVFGDGVLISNYIH